MFRLWSDWDIGEDNLIFVSKEAGIRWLQSNEVVAEIAAEDGCSIDDFITDCFDNQCFSWKAMEVIQ